MTSRTWEKVLTQLKNKVSDQVFETWLRPLRFVSREGSLLLVATPHKFFKQWIEENYMPKLVEAARKEFVITSYSIHYTKLYDLPGKLGKRLRRVPDVGGNEFQRKASSDRLLPPRQGGVRLSGRIEVAEAG